MLRPWGQGRKAKASEGENVAAFNCPLIQLRRSVCLLHCGSGGGRLAHVIESSPGQQQRKYSCERELRLHCLGKAGSLGGGGIVDLAAETQLLKTLGLSPCCCFFVLIHS